MILCCGEALIDMLPATTTSGGSAFAPHPGGAVFNTAIALGRLGIPTGLLTGLSEDMFGELLEEHLIASQVDTSFVIKSDRSSTLAFVKLSEGQATYSFFDENSAGRMLKSEDMPNISDDVSALYFGGISLACEPAADAYATFAETHGQNRLVMLDPNIRPSFIADERRYRDRIQRMIRFADIIKVSDEDLDWLEPGKMSVEHKAKHLLTLGPSVVILTKGAKGAVAYTGQGAEVSVASEPVSVVDTVGAGDTFNAGVLAEISKQNGLSKAAIKTISDQELGAALAFGNRVAAITVSRAGANPPWTDELGH